MGLMEKALEFKRHINSQGKETLIDKIQGPAETELLGEAEHEQKPLRDHESDIDEILVFDELDGKTETSAAQEKSLADDELFKLPDDDLVPVENGGSGVIKTDDFEIPPESKGAQPFDKRESSSQETSLKDDFLGVEDEPPPFANAGDAAGEEKTGATSAGTTAGRAEDAGARVVSEKTRIEEKTAFRSRRTTEEQTGSDEKKFRDFMVLYEIVKEIIRAGSLRELYDVILFSIMGQIGASSAIIMIPEKDKSDSWMIAEARGITVKNRDLPFDASFGILSKVIKSREVVDLESFKDLPDYRDEFFKFVSINARLMTPLTVREKVLGVIALGDKITIGNYSDEEKDFILSVSDISAIALSRIGAVDTLRIESEMYASERRLRESVNELIAELAERRDVETTGALLQQSFENAGILNFAVFMNEMDGTDFIPVVTDRSDTLNLKKTGFLVKENTSFVAYIRELKTLLVLQNPADTDFVKSVFSEAQMKKMTTLWLFPCRLRGALAGFIALFDTDKDREEEMRLFVGGVAQNLAPYLMYVNNQEQREARVVDSVSSIFKRIESSFNLAKDLTIPFTILLFSIKNLKRYYSLYGADDAAELINSFKDIIGKRLADTDYSVRLDRNRFMIILPGKNKKFAIPLANSIRNEISQQFRKKEMQLMIVYLAAEYPSDGDDLYSLLEGIE